MALDAAATLCHNNAVLGNSLAVGQRTLDSPSRNELVSNFLKSRRQGLSTKTIKFYNGYLNRSISVIGIHVTGQDITHFLNSLQCSGGGKHAYFRALRAFYRWLYSPRSGFNLKAEDNPMCTLDTPIREKRIMPSISEEQLEYLVSRAGNLRDECIIRLLFDSGMRLGEFTNISMLDIDWDSYTITVIGKGNKQRRAPFTERTARLVQVYLGDNHCDGNIWGLSTHGIETMLKRLGQDTGIRCNAHSFRRGFACLLRKAGVDTMTIKDLGRWDSLEMVQRYTRSVTFQDSLKFYKAPLS